MLAVVVVSIGATPLRGRPPERPPVARAWIVVDAETGAVLDASNEHATLRPASVVKVLTALIAVRALPANAVVPVSPTAASMPPEKIGMAAGESWPLSEVLHALLMVSANDAAVALSEAVSGSRARFAAQMSLVAASLGARDHPVLDDPAGLDDSSAFRAGDYVSAYDLAVMARAALAVPAIQDIVAARQPYEFTGPRGIRHVLRNQNRLLYSDHSAVGVKPGYTRAAGETLIAAATRGGRTVLSVELGSTPGEMYSTAEALLDRGFALPSGDEGGRGYLPPVRDPLPWSAGDAPSPAVLPRLRSKTASTAGPRRAAAVGLVGATMLVAVVAQRRRRQPASVAS
jgi:D-alanyl-D-alanine carboxypeptidase (penicillin-binding protein 5/6)